MILIDGDFLSSRIFLISANEHLANFKSEFKVGKRKSPYAKELYEMQKLYLHMFLNDILNIKSKFSNTYGDLVIAFDTSPSWRKRYYDKYKSHRYKDLQEFDLLLNKIKQSLKKNLLELLEITPLTVLSKLYTNDKLGVEGDDIIGVLVLEYSIDKHLIVSADQDFKQILNQRVKQFNPLHWKIIDTPTKKDVHLWKTKNLIAGQSKDGIPPIVHYCSFSQDFINWMKEKHDIDISLLDIDYIENNYPEYIEEYEKEKNELENQLVLEGKKKKRKRWSAYDNKPFGEKAAFKFANDLETNLKINERYEKHYERNKKLLLFEEIPNDVKEIILNKYKEVTTSKKLFDTIQFVNVLNKYRLFEIQSRLHEF